MFTNARIEDDVRAAPERDPGIQHPRAIAVYPDEIDSRSAEALEDVATLRGLAGITSRIEVA